MFADCEYQLDRARDCVANAEDAKWDCELGAEEARENCLRDAGL